MAAELVVRLMGTPGVIADGRAVRAFVSPRQLSLLAMLVVNRATPVARQRAAFELWPDSSEPQARTNLRQALHNLKRTLPDPERHLDVDGATVAWRLDSPACVDLIALDEAVLEVDGDDRATLERAVEAYPGDLLPGCDDEWVEPVRRRLHDEHVARVERLAEWCEEDDDRDAAIRVSQLLLTVDPHDESAYRRLMRLYGPADRARAVRTYHACVAALERDLGVAPSAETIAVYEHVVAAPVPSLPAGERGPARATRLIGRAVERAALLEAARASAAGACRVVIVHGEPGIGKTRLVADVVARCDRRAVATVTTRAYEADGRLPYAPVADVLRSSAVRQALTRVDEPWLDELARVVPDLLPGRQLRPPAAMPDDSQRTRMFTAVAEALRALGRPLVVAIDDLQWCDTDTLELLHFVVRTSVGVPLLILGTAREEGFDGGPLERFVSGLRAIDALEDVPLGRLSAQEAADLVAATLGRRPPDDVLRRVVDAAGGNPLFLVEMARADVESDELVLPDKVHAAIAARLAALSPPARALSEVAAVIGRRVDVDVLERLRPLGDVELAGPLDELWRRRILVHVAAESYDFGHDRIRDVAYAGVGPARRRVLHRQVARAIADLAGGASDEVAAAVAAHYEQGGAVVDALEHYQVAIRAAGRVFAHDEVITLGRQALALLGRLADGPDRTVRELAILGPLAVALHAGGAMTPDNRFVFDRIAALRAEGGPPIDPSVLRLTANWAIVNRRFSEPDEIGALLLERARTTGDRVLLTEGHYLRGVGNFWLGRMCQSADHLEQALAAYDGSQLVAHLERFAQDPRSVCLVRLALTNWRRGLADEAACLLQEARRRAADTRHEFTMEYVRVYAAWLAREAGDIERVEELIAPPRPEGHAWMSFALDAYAAWAASIRGGDLDEAIDRLTEIAAAVALEHPFLEPEVLLLLSSALADAGRFEAGLHAARQARDIASREHAALLAEAWWVEAELLHHLGRPCAEVGRALDEAGAVARAQGAVMLEHRVREVAARCGLVERAVAP